MLGFNQGVKLWFKYTGQTHYERFILLTCSKKQALHKHADSKKEAQGNSRCANPQEKHKIILKGFQWYMCFFFQPSLTEMTKWLKAAIKGQNVQSGTGKKATGYLKKSDVLQWTVLVKVNPSSNLRKSARQSLFSEILFE